MTSKLELLETNYPYILWREPVVVSIPSMKRLACRVCIATVGLKAVDLADLGFLTKKDFNEHFKQHLS